ncbi:unnamed protein product [Callosobruchus maculatus]|uniref:Uncharacterized protein n=1 Tax=Callosobruchus maculatus TaxID=64391 RepID=A0A653DJC6_CALMS|nr:unnamed protein product [Callosobruchus maculatus]
MIVMLSIYDHNLGLILVNTKPYATLCCTKMFNRATSSSSEAAIRVVSSANLKLDILLPPIAIPPFQLSNTCLITNSE